MKDLIGFIFVIIYGIIFLYLYTSFISYNDYIFFFSPELIYLYGLIGIYIYGLFRRMSKYDCLLSFSLLMYMVIKQYIIVLESIKTTNIEL
jgi:hypothetical protein